MIIWLYFLVLCFLSGYLIDRLRPSNSYAHYPSRRDWYHAYLDSPQWKDRRNKCLVRAHYRCEKTAGFWFWRRRCNSTYRLQVHHLNYDRVGHERLSDLSVRCYFCHRAEHPDKEF